MRIAYDSIEELARLAASETVTIGQLVLEEQAEQLGRTKEQLLAVLDEDLTVMEQAARRGGRKDVHSHSGLTGGDGWRMSQYAQAGQTLSGPLAACAMAIAISVAEYNAAMGRIVASPTAGSCGILPGAVLAMMEQRGASRQQACEALAAAGGIGLVLAQQASIAGAEGGCQAECGSAAAMAAAALVELNGGTPEMAANAAAMAIKNQLGLVCDPVAGLVEVPCIKRNGGGVMCALCAADMALAGIRSVIPVDEVVSAMREVGESLPCALRETAQGGLAATPTGQVLARKIFGAG